MKTQFALVENAGLNPSIVASLRAIPINSFSYQHYKLRHPGAIYNLMSSKLIDSISSLCQELKERKIENIKSSFRLVLYDFFQFYESCYEIMLCFCKPHELPANNEFIHSWLKKKKYKVGEAFFNNIKYQLEQLKEYYNEIKHSSNNIQFVVFKNKNEITPGYFLDMPMEAYPGAVEPTSLNRELRKMYFLVYYLSEKLNEVLSLHLKHFYGFDLLPATEYIKDDAFRKLSRSIDSLTEFYLLSEIGTTVYKYDIVGNVMIFTEKAISESLFDDYYASGVNLEMNLTHDGYNNSVFVPSCGLEQIGSDFYYKSKNGVLRQLKIVNY